jgi:hypothetical protein
METTLSFRLFGDATLTAAAPKARLRRSRVLHADDVIGRPSHPLRVCPVDRLVVHAGAGDDLGIGGLPKASRASQPPGRRRSLIERAHG